ncbi:MAG: SIS domain-containing protein [Elusimicrobia bacterium]|nr:SIS domain-containing protein [Elusimicrobiota bacterium]
MSRDHIESFLEESKAVLERLDREGISRLIAQLVKTREQGGRVFLLGLGGSASMASHAANDLRKICRIEAYAACDNVSELTARANDEGWETVFDGWLEASRLGSRDLLWIFSVGGGDAERGVSRPLLPAIERARRVGAGIAGVFGRDGGQAAAAADACLIVPTVNPRRVTAHTEGFQALIWHLVISAPALQKDPMKWEALGS